MFFDKPKLTPPNQQGYQFGKNESLTEYAHKEQPQWGGSSLPSVNITVLEVWKDDKREAYLLVDEKTNAAIDEQHGYEAAAVAIDKFKALKVFESYEDNKECNL